MSDHGEVEVENPTAAFTMLPKDALAEMGSIKLFNKWSYEDVEIRDISLTYVPPFSTLCGNLIQVVVNVHVGDQMYLVEGTVLDMWQKNGQTVKERRSLRIKFADSRTLNAATTFRSAPRSTSRTPLADMPPSASARLSARSLSVSPTRS